MLCKRKRYTLSATIIKLIPHIPLVNDIVVLAKFINTSYSIYILLVLTTKMQHAATTHSTQHTARNTQHTVHSTQQTACSMQHTAYTANSIEAQKNINA
jgi:hypothetical protein